MKILFYYLIFPGLVFSATIGLLAGWVDRKVTARLQWRVGPPWYQNFVDLIKLCGKEIIIPERAKATFLLAPLLGVSSLGLAAAILGVSVLFPLRSFAGDLIVVLYLLVMPAVALVMGASSSRNPLASVGAAREMKLILGYELPFLLSVATVILKAGGNIRLGEISGYQAAFGSVVFSWSGAVAFCVAILCMQAKIGYAPFEISEAEQEIMGGVLIEYSGLPLAVFKLTKAVMLYTMPVLLIVLFLGRDLSPLFMALKYVMLLVIIILIKNTNPRIRIDQALRFFWGPLAALAFVGVVLAVMGL